MLRERVHFECLVRTGGRLFGVELLIPEFLFPKHRREFPTGLEGVKGLAELFQTSLTATGIRYATRST